MCKKLLELLAVDAATRKPLRQGVHLFVQAFEIGLCFFGMGLIRRLGCRRLSRGCCGDRPRLNRGRPCLLDRLVCHRLHPPLNIILGGF
jgi:hypothetical protein